MRCRAKDSVFIFLWIGIFVSSVQQVSAAGERDVLMQKRGDMVEQQIERRGVKDKRVLDALKRVPRHEFVSPDLWETAYNDYPLPIGCGQTISQPYIVGLMTELAKPQAADRVLEVGTGSGYQAAVLAELVHEVYSIEIIPELSQEAGRVLEKLGYTTITLRVGDGYEGWKEKAPFDSIVVTAAADYVPPALIEQLKAGGRLVIPVREGSGYEMLKVIKKNADGSVNEENIIPVRFVPLVHEK